VKPDIVQFNTPDIGEYYREHKINAYYLICEGQDLYCNNTLYEEKGSSLDTFYHKFEREYAKKNASFYGPLSLLAAGIEITLKGILLGKGYFIHVLNERKQDFPEIFNSEKVGKYDFKRTINFNTLLKPDIQKLIFQDTDANLINKWQRRFQQIRNTNNIMLHFGARQRTIYFGQIHELLGDLEDFETHVQGIKAQLMPHLSSSDTNLSSMVQPVHSDDMAVHA